MSSYFDHKKIFDMPKVYQHGSHMVMKDGGGSSQKLYMNFDTRFSNDLEGVGGGGEAVYNFVLPVRLSNIQSMSVTNVEMPISYYNISAALGNNTFRITRAVSGNAWTVSLPDGQYDMGGLVGAVNAQLPSGVVFQVNPQGQSVFTVVSDPSGSSYYVEFYTDTLGGYDKRNPKFKLGWIMGFRYVAYPIAFGGGGLVSECILNLYGPRYLYLVVDEFQNGKENSFNAALGDMGMMKKNILCRVAPAYSEYPYGTIMPANLHNGALLSDTRRYCRVGGGGGSGGVDIQRLNVQLVNEIGQVVCLNGGNLAFCLEFEVAG